MKKEKIFLIVIPILCVLATIFAYLKVVKNETDAIRFKNEYEDYNGVKVSDKLSYSKLNIDEDNPIKYSDYDEIIDVIENKTGIIYLGFPECPWCRSALPVLLEAADENDINTIYYLNILNERDAYVVEDDKLVYQTDDNGNEKKGTAGYFRLLEALDEHLTDYVISYEGKEYETGEKRIYAPTIIFVKEGKVLGLHVSTVESHMSGFDKMTKDQVEELYGIYEDYILNMKETTCSSDSAC